MNNQVEKIFEAYIAQVYKGQTLHPTQHKEIKNAFFAAWVGCMHYLDEIATAHSEEDCMQMFQAMRVECKEHAENYARDFYKRN